MKGCLLIAVAAGLLLIAGCAHQRELAPSSDDALVSDLIALFDAAKAGDARYLVVEGRPYLVFDQQSQEALAAWPRDASLEVRRAFLRRMVERAATLGNERTGLELGRVPAAELARFAAAHALTASGTMAQAVNGGYVAAAARLRDRELATVAQLADDAALDAYRSELSSHIEESIKTKGRTWRQLALLPLAPFVRLWMGMHIATAADEIVAGDFSDATLYLPPTASDGDSDPAQLGDEALLARYAPVIAVEHKDAVSYDLNADRFGEVQMSGVDLPHAQPRIDIEHPAVYTYVQHATIDAVAVKQLVYTFWFPERPKLNGAFDPEVGTTQGAIIRVTLNAANEPVIYENVSSCGCYYKVFPAAELEQRAARQYGAPLKHKRFALENDVPRKIDVNIPNLVEGEGRVVASYTAGAHDVATIAPFEGAGERAHRTYRMLPYEALESLPFNGGTISMFDEEGLVRSADRLEATLLAASGMYHAGTPRQRGTLMIYFDQADFDDPALLARYLRLPRGAFAADRPVATLAH
ncbi:MAG TPA: hypothetical protein PJ986_13145 [Gammaproteobacteria bacterium]|nr:hypothetical protein [Gammaproteobacteria bacterium]